MQSLDGEGTSIETCKRKTATKTQETTTLNYQQHLSHEISSPQPIQINHQNIHNRTYQPFTKLNPNP